MVSAIGRLSATEMKRSGIEVRKQTGTQSGWSRCSRQHNADGHACMGWAQCGVCYRQAVRDRDEAERNRGALHVIEHTVLAIKKNYKGFENIGKVFWIY